MKLRDTGRRSLSNNSDHKVSGFIEPNMLKSIYSMLLLTVAPVSAEIVHKSLVFIFGEKGSNCIQADMPCFCLCGLQDSFCK